MILSDELLLNTYGGKVSITSVLNALTRLITTMIDVGRSIGSAIKYKVSKKSCGC